MCKASVDANLNFNLSNTTKESVIKSLRKKYSYPAISHLIKHPIFGDGQTNNLGMSQWWRNMNDVISFICDFYALRTEVWTVRVYELRAKSFFVARARFGASGPSAPQARSIGLKVQVWRLLAIVLQKTAPRPRPTATCLLRPLLSWDNIALRKEPNHDRWKPCCTWTHGINNATQSANSLVMRPEICRMNLRGLNLFELLTIRGLTQGFWLGFEIFIFEAQNTVLMTEYYVCAHPLETSMWWYIINL